MGNIFPPQAGEMEINVLYADNEIHCREVRFSIPNERWSEFESSQVFEELKNYVNSLQTPNTQKPNCEQERKWGTGALKQSSNHQGYCESFLAQVRRAFFERLQR